MSSFKSAIIRPVKRRLGFATVVGGSAFATALVTGNSTAAAVVALAVVVVAILMASAGGSSEQAGRKRAPGQPYAASYQWEVDEPPDLAGIALALDHQRLGLRPKSQSQQKIILRGGSQFWLRLIGGYFIHPKRLPVEVELSATPVHRNEKTVVQLGIRDTFGISIRDEALEDRFTQAVESIRRAVGGQLTASGGRGVGGE